MSFGSKFHPELFWLPDGHASRALEQQSTDAHNQQIVAYRRLAARAFEALASRD